MALCELKNVSKTYMDGEMITPIHHLNFEIDKGDFVSIRGESGIGKSTLLMLISGLIKPSEGSVFYDGKQLEMLPDSRLTEWRGHNIGYIFQNVQLVQALTVQENIELSSRFGNSKQNRKSTEELINRLGLWEKRNVLPHLLSGGQKRRAMIATALIRNPQMILADEPTNDLDDTWADEIINMLEGMAKKGKTVIVVTHNKKYADYAGRSYKLEKGCVVPVL